MRRLRHLHLEMAEHGVARLFVHLGFPGVAILQRDGACGGRTRADLVDQSRLYGLLNRLRDLGLELIRVDRIFEGDGAR